MPREELTIVDAELSDNLVVGPNVEFALLAFEIGIERSRESALRRRHLALEPADRFVSAPAIKRIAVALIGDRQEFEELRIVVEHFFEMRREPTLVHRVARKTAAEMVVDAALADMIEGDLDGGKIARFAGAQAGPPEQLEQSGLGEFRRTARAAIDGIDDAAELPRGIVEFVGPIVAAPALRAVAARRSISAARFCSIFCGSSRNSRAISWSTSTKAGLP